MTGDAPGNIRGPAGAMLSEAGKPARRPPRAHRSPSGPVRTCVGCRARADRSVLLRVVAVQVGGTWTAVPDPRRRRPGRGAWVHPSPACLDLAARRTAFARALRLRGPLDLAPLREHVEAVAGRAPSTTGRQNDHEQ